MFVSTFYRNHITQNYAAGTQLPTLPIHFRFDRNYCIVSSFNAKGTAAASSVVPVPFAITEFFKECLSVSSYFFFFFARLLSTMLCSRMKKHNMPPVVMLCQ